MNIRQALAVFVAGSLVASVAMGAAPVTDPTADRIDRLESQVSAQTADDLPTQVRQLQEALQELRGRVEVIEHKLDQMGDRQRDMYSDLDSRLSDLEGKTKTPAGALSPAKTQPAPAPTNTIPGPADTAPDGSLPPTTPGSPPPGATPPPPGAPSTSVKDYQKYQAAYDLLQQKKYDQAIKAFNEYVKTYPNGQFAANAYYWIGETQIINHDLNAAKVAFQKIVNDYPTHQKSADALLKLGYVYDASGQKDKALKTLTQVTTKYPGSTVARMADQRISQIKQRS